MVDVEVARIDDPLTRPQCAGIGPDDRGFARALRAIRGGVAGFVMIVVKVKIGRTVVSDRAQLIAHRRAFDVASGSRDFYLRNELYGLSVVNQGLHASAG